MSEAEMITLLCFLVGLIIGFLFGVGVVSDEYEREIERLHGIIQEICIGDKKR